MANDFLPPRETPKTYPRLMVWFVLFGVISILFTTFAGVALSITLLLLAM